MEKDDLLISILSLLIVLMFVLKPLYKKIFTKQVEKSYKKKQSTIPPREDPVYQSVESYAQRIIRNDESTKKIRILEPEIKAPVSEKPGDERVVNRIARQSSLKKAMIWKEILSAPLSLKDSEHLF